VIAAIGVLLVSDANRRRRMTATAAGAGAAG
jgi:hypothetical protein